MSDILMENPIPREMRSNKISDAHAPRENPRLFLVVIFFHGEKSVREIGPIEKKYGKKMKRFMIPSKKLFMYDFMLSWSRVWSMRFIIERYFGEC